MLDRTNSHTLSASRRRMTTLGHETVLAVAAQFEGADRDRLMAIGLAMAGDLPHAEAAQSIGLSSPEFFLLLRSFHARGIVAAIRDSQRDSSRIEMRDDYSAADVRKLLSEASDSVITRRLEVVALAYEGLNYNEIADRMNYSANMVHIALREFNAFGHLDLSEVTTPVLDGHDAALLRTIAETASSAFTSKRAMAAAMFIEGASIDDIARSFNIKAVTVLSWLKVFERNGIDGLYTRPHTDGVRRKEKPEIKKVAPRKPAVDSFASAVLADALKSVVDLAKTINPKTLHREARSIKSYTAKVRLNAISQVARGKSLQDVGRQCKSDAVTVAGWIKRYRDEGYEALAA